MTYFDLGPYSRKITTSSPDAQLWFDRGLNWVFGFNHAEAIKCFQQALQHDSRLRDGTLGHQLRVRPPTITCPGIATTGRAGSWR